jgi:hypothetical protein
MAYRNYGPNAGLVVNPNGQGDFTTVGAALAAATSGKTIYLYPATYVENITLKAGVNIVAWDADAPSKNVTIKGTCSYSAAGNVFISGICLETNGSYFLSVTGILASSVTLTECYLNCTDFTGINFTSSSANANISMSYCQGNLTTAGIAYFTSSSPGAIGITYCNFANSGPSLTASTTTGSTLLFIYYTLMASYINTGFSASLEKVYLGYTGTNTTALTVSGGIVTATGCYFIGGTQPAISVAATLVLTHSTIVSSNANAIADLGGSGILKYSCLSFTGPSSNINTSVQTQLPSGLPLSVTNGGTGLASTTINQLLYSSAANTISGLATGNNGVLITSATGVPSLIANGITGQVLTATTGAPVSWTTPTSGTVTSVSGTAGQITVVNGTTTPVISIAATYVGQTSITTLGTISSGVWNGTAVTVPYGGTGLTSTTAYSLICGGTTTTSSLQSLASVAAGQILTSNGVSALPAYSATLPSTVQSNITSVGTITSGTWHGTAVTVPYGGTGLTSTTANQILYSSAANTIAGLATGNNGVLVTSATGVPSILANGTTGQVLTATTGAPVSWTTPTSGTVTSVSGTAGQITVVNGTTTPVISIAATYVGQTSITTLGTITSGVWNGTAITVPYGGTGAATLTGVLTGNGTSAVTASAVTQYAVLVGGASNTITSVPDVATGSVLVSGGVAGNPSFSATPTLTSVTFGSGSILNNYTQGTFVPTITGQTTAGVTTYTTQTGNYIRIGRQVTGWGVVAGTAATGTGVINVGFVGFTAAADAVGSIQMSLNGVGWALPAGTTFANLKINTSATSAVIIASGAGVATTQMSMGTGSFTFIFSMSYLV